jgi:hypothetical protein
MKDMARQIDVKGIVSFTVMNGTAAAQLIPATATQLHSIMAQDRLQCDTLLDCGKVQPVAHDFSAPF